MSDLILRCTPENYAEWHPTPSTDTISMGMNLPGLTYYDPSMLYTDPMKQTLDWITSYDGSGWNTGLEDELSLDSNGYPTEMPQVLSDGEDTYVKLLVNNYYTGKYYLKYDGTGTVGPVSGTDANGDYLTLDGTGNNVVLHIYESSVSDPVINWRLIPEEYVDNEENMPKFRDEFLAALDQFNPIRLMDLGKTNNSTLSTTRIPQTYRTQAQHNQGMCYEDMIELCNYLQKDAWVCIPHVASDAYMQEVATLFRDNLDSNLKIYLEYSNELWNWIFDQAIWGSFNATGVEGESNYNPCPDQYVIDDLDAISAPGDAGTFTIKHAYLIARCFKNWRTVFGDSALASRVIRVAAYQTANSSLISSVLNYLFNIDGEGCDALGVTDYFNPIGLDVHNEWVAAETAGTLDYETMYNDAVTAIDTHTLPWLREARSLCNTYNVLLVGYEGGQHMQPYNQGVYNYNQRLYDFQITSYMYDLYERMFVAELESDIAMDVRCVFSYMGLRESQYGSWGHIENEGQIGTDYSVTAPKFQACLDYAT